MLDFKFGRRRLICASHDCLEELEGAFYLFANDDRITYTDLGKIMNILEGGDYYDEELKSILKSIGTEEEGFVTFDEFKKVMAAKIEKMEKPDSIKEAFQTFDINGSGMVSTEHIRNALTGLGDHATEYELNDLMSGFDGTTAINYDAAVNMYESKLSAYKSATQSS